MRRKRQVLILDPLKMFVLAEEFLRASRFLIEVQRRPGFNVTGIVPRPNVMIHCVSLELFLKCLYVLDYARVPEKIHHLKRLYDSLAFDTKQRMNELFDPTAGQKALDDYRRQCGDRVPIGLPSVFTFDFALTGSSGAFEHVRFAYERESRPTEQWLGEPLVIAARQVILERNPMWANAPTIGTVMPTKTLPTSPTRSGQKPPGT